MSEEELKLPQEIPWKLASTTQPLRAGGPDETAVSLFYHEPENEALIGVPEGEKLVYLKMTTSVSPCSLEPVDSELASAFLGDNLPVLHVLLDLKITPQSGETGGIHPYFHTAAPLNRRVVETGVVGHEVIEGASDGQFFGKSGSQLYESLSSTTNTSTAGGGVSLAIPGTAFGIGGSAHTTSTSVESDRAVEQVVDTTTREASQERRELLSHITHVKNVLTLLSGKFVGTPYLRFSLFPRPMQLLSVDPTDTNLWFAQLLRQRSSGIEGVQEFTAVAVVPQDQNFCVEARLRRVCLLDDPPGPPNFNERLIPDILQLARMVNYLYNRYPKGTPLDELDIDVIGDLKNSRDFRRPVVRLWAFRLGQQVVEALVASTSKTAGIAAASSVNYKHMLEIWLETLRDEYERELARSPLERGSVLGEHRFLDTCFNIGEDGNFFVATSSRATTPLVPVDFDTILPEIDDAVLTPSVRARATQTITRWNALEQRLNVFLSHLEDLPDDRVRLNDPRIANVVISRWGKMEPNDPRNIDVKKAAKILGLSSEQTTKLTKAGVADLRDISRALTAASEIDMQNREISRFRDDVGEGKDDKCVNRDRDVVLPEPIDFSISTKDAESIRHAVAKGLGRGWPRGREPKTRSRSKRRK